MAGLNFETGDGIADKFAVLTGHVGDVNVALRGAVYRGDANWNTLGTIPNNVTITASNSHTDLGGQEPVAVEAEAIFW